MPPFKPPIAVLDACVLYPAAQRDLFMWLAALGVIRAHWTDEIHDEWMRNVKLNLGIERSVLERVRRLMDHAAGDALIVRYRQYERHFPKTDAKDRHVAAAAMATRIRSDSDSVTIITWNLKDFDPTELQEFGLVAETPEDFLCRLLLNSPQAVVAAFIRMRDNLKDPPKTSLECTDTLREQGMGRFSQMLLALVD